MNTKTKLTAVCTYCNLKIEIEDDEEICSNATEASACSRAPHNRPKFKPQVVGPDFERIEDNPIRLAAIQGLIRDGAAWHPAIDQDGSIGRQASDLIERKLCKPPRSYEAKRARHMFDVAQRFGIDQKAPRSPEMQAFVEACLPNTPPEYR